MNTDRELLKAATQKNWRGIRPDVLVCEIQDLQDKLEMLERYPDEAIGFDCPKGCAPGEWIDDHRFFWQSMIENIQAEIMRRRVITLTPRANTDKEIIETIKSRLPITDVLEWYTEVIYSGRRECKYRCNRHGDGQDKNPSGVIYTDENKYWCFVCNKGGDIFDAVQAWEGCDLPTAITRLAKYLGLDTKPLIPNLKAWARGGIRV